MWILTFMNQTAKKCLLYTVIYVAFFDWWWLSCNSLFEGNAKSHDCCLQVTSHPLKPASDLNFLLWSLFDSPTGESQNSSVLPWTTLPLEKLCAGFTSWFSGLSLVHEKLLSCYTQVMLSWSSPQLLRVKIRSPTNRRKSPAERANSIDRRPVQHMGMYL